jgi:hypothetical protein
MDSPLWSGTHQCQRGAIELDTAKLAHAQMVEKELDLERRNEIGGPEAPASGGERGETQTPLAPRARVLVRLGGENGAYGGVW